MNLHRVASRVIGAVNPNQLVTVQTSTGPGPTAPDGKRSPTYAPPFRCFAQVQELTTRDLRQLDALNVQGSMRSIYLNGHVNAIERMTQKGGDLIKTPDGKTWLTTTVLESWPGWCKVSVTLQDVG